MIRALGMAMAVTWAVSAPSAWAQEQRWSCRVLPAEHEVLVEPDTGAKVVFATTHPGTDRNLYFHDRSWLSDGSLAVFYSDRGGRQTLYGYAEATGNLVELIPEGQPPAGSVTCSRRGNRIYGVCDGAACAWAVACRFEPELRVEVRRRRIADLPRNGGLTSSLNENADGRLLSVSFVDADAPGVYHIAVIEVQTGRITPVARVDFPVSHVQFSWTRPDLLMFARTYPQGDRMPQASGPSPVAGAPGHVVGTQPAPAPHYRIWLVDLSGKPPWPIYPQVPDELVTHECWWTEERLTFCGGHHVPDESHVKVFDLKTGRISIIGAGSWWPAASQRQITRRSWWHAAGSPDGRWVVADNFHGDIVLFDALTTRERPLTTGHRKLGQPHHPHPGWAESSDRVVFTSNRRGNPDLAIAYVPAGWR
ncbi:MAG: PD40 domain-containing protein [Phycisphaerae bacterium]|jgi:hypothetical protein